MVLVSEIMVSETKDVSRFFLLLESRLRVIVLAFMETAVSAKILESDSRTFCSSENLIVSLLSAHEQTKSSKVQ